MRTNTKFSTDTINLFTAINNLFNTNVMVVGGYVRDLLLGKEPKDLDFVIPTGCSNIQEFKAVVSANIPGVKFVEKGGEEFQCCTFVYKGEEYDAVMPRTETYTNGSRKPEVKVATLAEDAQRRDFTINALYMDVTGEIYDPTGRGVKDIEGSIIHFAGNPDITFVEDPLRILRAVRFAVTKSFWIDNETEAAMKKHADKFRCGGSYISWERIGVELKKILSAPNSIKVVNNIRLLHNVGVLKAMLTGLDKTFDYNQMNPHHEDTLEQHLFNTLIQSAKALRNLGPVSTQDLFLVQAAALFHDIAKPESRQWDDENGYATYHGHDKASAEMAKEIALTLRWTSEEAEKIAFIISKHMRLTDVVGDDGLFNGSNSALRRIRRDFTINGDKPDGQGEKIDMALHCLCLIAGDKTSHVGGSAWANTPKDLLDKIAAQKAAEKAVEEAAFKIDGKTLIERYGVSGREISSLKSKLQQLQDDNQFTTFEDLLNYYDSVK